jgi:thiol:disulfide interchange protein DsbC
MPRPLVLVLALAAAAPAPAADDLAAAFSARLGTAVTLVKPTPIEGLYEVRADGQIVYMTRDARYAIQGSLIDLEVRRNLTEDARAEIRRGELAGPGARGTLDFPAVGQQKHAIFIFTDVDCGYCRKLHQEVPKLNQAGVTVRYLAYPRAGLESDAYRIMASVWCADDPRAALTAAKSGAAVPEKTCDNPVRAHFDMGNRMGVQGTPSILLEDGTELGGYAPAQQIVQALEQRR